VSTFFFFIYLAGLAFLGLLVPAEIWDVESKQFLLVLGAIATWRYLWGLTHLVRSLIYRYVVFPRWRRKANALGQDGMPPHVYVLITSFRIAKETTRQVYSAAIRELIDCRVPGTLVASLVDQEDADFIEELFREMNPPSYVDLQVFCIKGTGKRDALAAGFKAIQYNNPPPGSMAAVVDGDTIMDPGSIRLAAPLFKLHPKAAALTTDEFCIVEGSRLMRDWHSLRFAQRQILMCSVGLSKRVLTLTGRLSIFRAEILADQGFIDQVHHDYLDHWRLGRFKFLTGDDKSSWFWILKNGYEMLYVPDVRITTIEHPPSDNFFVATTVLMRRWFGNMLRTNGRALALGPKPMGLFTWWCILDQRLSMWTALSGPTFALIAAFAKSPIFLLIYALWVGFTRFLLSLTLLTSRSRISPTYPFLLWYTQVYGSLIKTHVLFRLDKQKWTRQNTALKRNLNPWQARIANWGTIGVQFVAMLTFITAVAVLSGVLPPPTARDLTRLFF